MKTADVRSTLWENLESVGKKQVRLAWEYAENHLSGIFRRSGENYMTHGCEVAMTLRELTTDPSMLSVGILHDILVLPDGDAILASAPLSESEKNLIRRLHPLRRLHIDANTEDLDRVIHAFTDDARLLPLRMAHRLNDVRHLTRFTHKLRRQIANETLHMYAAIASRLGMHIWRYEMEDICFRLLQPRIAKHLEEKFQACARLDSACLEHAKRFIVKTLKAEGVSPSIDGRIKRLYSTYRKMVIKKRRFEELTDRLALRVIVPGIKDCYHALGVVHATFHPIPGKLKDYIGAPKENGYRSIHTVVYPLPGVTEQPIEIQIRTAEMNGECEYGAARHGEYKNAVYALHTPFSRVNLFRNLQTLREETRSPKQFETALRTYFNDDHIALFDSKNNLYHLKKPVSALDFICHTLGKRCRYVKSVRVNGRERSIGAPLRDGDTLEVRCGKIITIKSDWLHACHHHGSRKLIRSLLKKNISMV